MTTQAIIYALEYSIKTAHEAQMEHGPKVAEEILKKIQLMWLRERPLAMHTKN